jgi:sortase A
MNAPRQNRTTPGQHPGSLTVNPLTAIGVLLILSAVTALVTYFVLIVPGQVAASQGPPEEFIAAATRQAQLTHSDAVTPESTGEEDGLTSTPSFQATPTLAATIGLNQLTPTANPHGDWPLPDYVEADYWLSIPALGLEAPIIGLAPREREEDGVMVMRLPVPNSYSVAWDTTSPEPGFGGNTILTGHQNVYGGVFAGLNQLHYGAEVAVWSEYGVFSYYVSVIEYIEEDEQPLDVKTQNAHWLDNTPDNRLTLITCWPHNTSTHRLIVIATR